MNHQRQAVLIITLLFNTKRLTYIQLVTYVIEKQSI